MTAAWLMPLLPGVVVAASGLRRRRWGGWGAARVPCLGSWLPWALAVQGLGATRWSNCGQLFWFRCCGKGGGVWGPRLGML